MTKSTKLEKLFDDWLTMLFNQAKTDQDAAWLYLKFSIGYILLPPNDETTEQIRTQLFLSAAIKAARERNHTEVAKELQSLIRELNENGIPLPEELRGFYPEDFIKRKKGRSYWDNIDKYKAHAKMIYQYCKKQGEFPASDLAKFDIWEVLYYFDVIIYRQEETNKGISNRLDAIIKELGVYNISSSTIKQIYLGDKKRNLPSYRRLLVIEDIANYCIGYWKAAFEWKA